MSDTLKLSQLIPIAISNIATVSDSSKGPLQLVEANSSINLTFSNSITVIYDIGLFMITAGINYSRYNFLKID